MPDELLGRDVCRWGPSIYRMILTTKVEHFFEEMATGQFRIPDNVPLFEECAARHNLRFTGPPLAVDEAAP
ncbi:hypothetical protein JQU17_05590 [Ponticoccus sp. SC2-23]|uniref:hypothetical protein n=1 Tax=Alexandriicola marinus TaxID=2081710 RepID=UPI000FDB282D|nr:hypothetical protein [Alexandriicola marinus]MBM1219663.1 hypothetical protein [Ponticoccus sp. SC6-9]MBM1223265.1 hypothetical protein [Ponticoccus sp. SC6-15]MBM1229476.1 hypothetical protein [Ponticoccus sp. SC6-38]MBM1232231.1 hypothetical protein [Ponticoccus sp. SC6-45]MBM1237819.1 hypothetical protein [Ponticoccus sp. SC6-49]MBM1241242.1 hypothetical protein [Ponticoccus sp. SC2-64]MBM1245755.1 hypothetical protein [Ponticoccus sp. SC6-42]MBM1250233.1 hypothetical protein [Pontico